MLAKFSVKKPYTVFVAVILVIILGVVSFMNMTADLLPSMNLPYALVMTTYPGASPEEVETVVTKPVEQAMATVSNVENIQSVSSENVSMVIMEFSQTTNMDSVSLEMRENLDQITGYWDDGIGSPIIMKLNPTMLPVMIAAIEMEDMDGVEISQFTEDELLSEIESLEGVASVSTSGMVEESVQVIIRQDKIDTMNNKIADALGLTFKEAREELVNAQDELDKAQQEIDNGMAQMESGKSAMASQLSDAKTQLSSKQMELLKTEVELQNKLDQITTAEQELDTTESQLTTMENLLTQAEQKIQELNQKKAQYEEMMQALKDIQLENLIPDYTIKNEELENLKAQLEQLIASGSQDSELIGQLNTQIASLQAQIAEIEQKLRDAAIEEFTEAGIINAINKVQSWLDSTISDLATANAALDALLNGNTLEQLKQQIAEGKAQITDGRAQLASAKQQITSAQEQLSSGKITLEQASQMLNQQEITATIEMASAQAQLISGQTKLDEGKAQLEEGREQLEQAQEDALEQAKLEGKITTDLISQILMAQNFSMPAGYVTEEGIQYLVRVGDKFTSTEDMENLVLFDMGLDDLNPIKLSDVAEVVVVDDSSEVYARINGNPGVVLSIQKQTEYSTGDVSDRIKDRFDELMEEYPGLDIVPLMDQGNYIDLVIDSVLNNLISGAVLAVLILYVFLKDIRPTAVVACSIPISVMTAIVLMYFSGISLNIISLSGLALGVGMLVDNSIVVIENIYRMRDLGVPIRKAAVAGAKQVAGAIVASTLTTVCVFLPIVFTEGITRQLFVDMGLTIGYSLGASLIIALTLVPAMATGMLKKKKETKHPLMDKMIAGYGKLMETILNHKAWVLIFAVVVLVLSAMWSMSKGTSFIPNMESTQASLTVTMPDGSSLEETGAMTDEVMSRLEDIEDITDMGAMAGSSSGLSMLTGGGSGTSASVYLILSEDKEMTGAELEEAILSRTEDLDCEVSVTTNTMDMSALGGSGISLQIKGKELDTLQEISADVVEILEGIEGLEEISDGMEESTEELRLVVDKAKASEHNLTVAQVYQQVYKKLAESSSATTLSTESRDYDVVVIDEQQTEYTREDVKGFTIEATDLEGNTEEIPVEELVSFENAVSPDSINRINQSRYMTVSASVGNGYNVGILGSEVEDALKDYEVPEGYSIEMTGENETINEAMYQLLKMLGLGVVFIYLIMVAQFQSLLSPFIVMFTIPLAFTGGFLGLAITGSEISVISMIGFVMLSGIIVNNGIVLVDYTNQLRAEGMEKREALIKAGKTRMRPILMTALTTILGLSTMGMGVGMGADMVQPMAIVTIGGLTYGTLLTLFVVPCIYDILNRKEYCADDGELDDIELIPETVE